MTDGSYSLKSPFRQALRAVGKVQSRAAVVASEIDTGVSLSPHDGAKISDVGIILDLRSDRGGYVQGTHNISRAQAATSAASKGLAEIKSLTNDIAEYSQLAAIDTTPTAQRNALDAEVQAISARITAIGATTYNGTALFTSARTERAVQLGNEVAQVQKYRLQDLSDLNLGVGTYTETSTTYTANGTFQTVVSQSAGDFASTVVSGDLNGDGALDIVYAAFLDDQIFAQLGNGDGTFQARVSLGPVDGPYGVALGDINGDGALDVVTGYATGSVQYRFGNGDGTFSATASALGGGVNATEVYLHDLTGDGALDIIAVDEGGSTINVYVNSGTGTFGPRLSSATPAVTPYGLAFGDFDEDGKQDVAIGESGPGILLYLGQGNGGFNVGTPVSSVSRPITVVTGDVNDDGHLDLVNGGDIDGKIQVRFGVGDGTFAAAVSIAAGNGPRKVELQDVNDDGALDIVSLATTDGTLNVFLNSGTGTFSTRVSYSGYTGALELTVGDFNSDGANDIVATAQNQDAVYVALGGTTAQTTTESVTLSRFDLTTQRTAEASYSLAGNLSYQVADKVAQSRSTEENLATASLQTERTIGVLDEQISKAVTPDEEGLRAELLKLNAILPIASKSYLGAKESLESSLKLFRSERKKV